MFILTLIVTFFSLLNPQHYNGKSAIIDNISKNIDKPQKHQDNDVTGQPVQVVFSNIKNEIGEIWISMCQEKQLWNKDNNRCSYRARIPAKEGATYIFSDIKTGTYAITAFHDEDNNMQLDFDTFGIPFEPIGFSKNAVGNYGPPTFNDMKFVVKPKTNGTVLTMNIILRRNGSN